MSYLSAFNKACLQLARVAGKDRRMEEKKINSVWRRPFDPAILQFLAASWRAPCTAGRGGLSLRLQNARMHKAGEQTPLTLRHSLHALTAFRCITTQAPLNCRSAIRTAVHISRMQTPDAARRHTLSTQRAECRISPYRTAAGCSPGAPGRAERRGARGDCEVMPFNIFRRP